jgi:hypothetical protein
VTLPAERNRILARVLDPPAKYAYKVGPMCANPGCGKQAGHAHHIASRAALAGIYDWIEIDGVIIGNKTGLCAKCHGEIHAEKFVIQWIEGAFWWCLPLGSKLTNDRHYHPIAPLSYQPPTPDTLAEREAGTPAVESEHCPMCGQFKRRRPRAGGPRLRRKTWIVKVPDSEVEDGAEVLDTLVENLSLLIPDSDAGLAGRYYVLVHSLAYSTMHSANFAQTLTGEGG